MSHASADAAGGVAQLGMATLRAGAPCTHPPMVAAPTRRIRRCARAAGCGGQRVSLPCALLRFSRRYARQAPSSSLAVAAMLRAAGARLARQLRPGRSAGLHTTRAAAAGAQRWTRGAPRDARNWLLTPSPPCLATRRAARHDEGELAVRTAARRGRRCVSGAGRVLLRRSAFRVVTRTRAAPPTCAASSAQCWTTAHRFFFLRRCSAACRSR